MGQKHFLTIPLRQEDLGSVRAGDAVFLSGPLFTARPRLYRRILEEGQAPPVDLQAIGANVLLHCGPLIRQRKDNSWEVVTIVAMPDWMADGTDRNVERIIERLRLRAVIGKGLLNESPEICQKHACLHLITVGTWNNFARQIDRVVDVGWLDLGLTEAMWVFSVNRMGPFIVETDSFGRSLYAETRQRREQSLAQVLKSVG